MLPIIIMKDSNFVLIIFVFSVSDLPETFEFFLRFSSNLSQIVTGNPQQALDTIRISVMLSLVNHCTVLN